MFGISLIVEQTVAFTTVLWSKEVVLSFVQAVNGDKGRFRTIGLPQLL